LTGSERRNFLEKVDNDFGDGTRFVKIRF
jgi:hypothetical protein